jgi:DNA/RNA-binding domain of Phe-tRNA-synthetase-like protein
MRTGSGPASTLAAVFAYDSAIVDRFPTIRAGVVHATGLANGASPSGLLDAYRAEQREVADRLGRTAIADHASIAAWRRVFSSLGSKPTQYRNAAEALLRRLSKHGDIPSINTLVDIGNLVSIRYAMPVAVCDQATVVGSTTVRFATGAERFTDLGSSQTAHPEPGEVVFVDDDETVSARRWCWRQSAQSATSASTVEALVVIEGHHESAARDVELALADVQVLLAAHQPDSRTASYALSPEHPSAP